MRNTRTGDDRTIEVVALPAAGRQSPYALDLVNVAVYQDSGNLSGVSLTIKQARRLRRRIKAAIAELEALS